MWTFRKKAPRERHPFYVQTVQLTSRYEKRRRKQVFVEACQGKSVLHVGFVGSSVSKPEKNLHLTLGSVTRHLDGVDPNVEGFAKLREQGAQGGMYPSLEDLPATHYDVVLVPEVLEHVDNVQLFLASIDRLDFDEIYLAVPDAFQCAPSHFKRRAGDVFTEVVHPDHNCWYSPYTIGNVIRKYTSWDVIEVGLFNKKSVLVRARKLSQTQHPRATIASGSGLR